MRTSEELYLIGLHLEQYRHATFRPEDYYREALRRDPGDARCNQALGLLFLRRGDPRAGEAHLRRAVERLTARNPNPSDGAPFLFLGLALEMQERESEAADAYHKAAWNGGTRAAAHAALSRLAMRRGDFRAALESTGESLDANPRDPSIRTIRAMALRKLGLKEEAFAELGAVLDEDPLSHTALHERAVILAADGGAGPAVRERHVPSIGDPVHAALETASDYISCGLYEEAASLLEGSAAPVEGPFASARGLADDPLVCYMLAWRRERLGDRDSALRWIRRADSLPPAAMFVNQLEAWDRSRAADPGFPTVRRNIALATFNKLRDPSRARAELEKAFSLDASDARVLLELDQLRGRRGVGPAERRRLLEEHLEVVQRRDDLTVEWITLLNLCGEHARALELLCGRKFHPWEGGEGRVTRQYVTALLGLARDSLQAGDPEKAAAFARRAMTYPANLGEGKLAGASESDIFYYLGCALQEGRDSAGARDAFEKAAVGEADPGIPLFYNDQPADMIFFQGLALARLERAELARGRFNRLTDWGERRRGDRVSIDYFAVSLPDMLIFEDDLTRRNRIFCTYIMGLGALGRADLTGAAALLREVLAADPAHAGAREILRDIERGWRF